MQPGSWRSPLWPFVKRYLQHSTRPILAGPFRGEVGFEVLYWIPFLRRFLKRYGIAPERLIPVTRGGASLWYGGSPQLDLYDLRTPQLVRVENRIQHATHHQLKQIVVTGFDRQVLRDFAFQHGFGRYLVLHPAWMYACLMPYFAGAMSLAALEQHCFFETIPTPMLPGSGLSSNSMQLPEEIKLPMPFVAVRFYLRHTFPGHPTLVNFAQESIKMMAQSTAVVLLNSGIHADEHVDIPMPDHPNVFRMTDLCHVTPQNNLAVQSALIGRALGFVGTYGGLAQLALRLGKPSVSYYHEWGGTSIAHKHLADALALKHNIPCLVLKVGELPVLQSVVPALQVAIP